MRRLLIRATVSALILVSGAMPTPSRAQGLGDCTNPPPRINARALQKLPASVQHAVAGFADLIQAQALNVPGVSVAVVIDQDVIFAGGFGCATLPTSSSPGVAATPSTFYRIESVTKVFEAVMMMQQRDRLQVFQLTDPVADLVPPVFFLVGTKSSNNPYSPTYLQLASHTSGLPDPIPDDLTTVDEYFQFLEAEIVPQSSVGVYSYSDQGFVAMSQAVAIITNPKHPSYHKYVRNEIFHPLKMHRSTYDETKVPKKLRATPYIVKNDEYQEDPTGLVNDFPPAGNVWTSVLELSQMVSLQFRTKARGPGQILACTSIQEMWEAVAPAFGNTSTTIGWFRTAVPGRPVVINKNGGDPTWSALVQFVPTLRLGVVALTNVGAPIAKDVPMSELVKIEDAILNSLIPLLPSSPPVCSP
jgi:CubicO group peptidase (beta-lactamase class C family)